MEKTLKIHPLDNVGVALADLAPSDQVNLDGQSLTIKQPIAQKHKFALHDLEPGGKIYQYGVIVGEATESILRGQAITVQNITNAVEEKISHQEQDFQWQAPDVTRFQHKEFMGYHRSNGKVGTANYWIFIPLVFCENRNIQVIREAMEKALGYAKPDKYLTYTQSLLSGQPEAASTQSIQQRIFENIDGIKFLTHQMGCGGTRDDAEMLVRILAGYIHHPNVAGATVLSLGCQNAQVELLQAAEKRFHQGSDKPVFYFEQQQEASEEALIKKAIKTTLEALREANQQQRKPAPLSELTIGVECGGSDGFSGISANPVIGQVSDLIVALGGSSILSEFPELHGIEQELVNRCISGTVAEKFIRIQQAYHQRAKAVGSGFDQNPSPGNIKDGLITDAIKSAGAAKKGGTSPVVDVLDYAEPLRKKGLNLLCTPGNDVESTTGLAGSGSNIILFSTGLGTPTGNPVSPVIKISSNTRLASRMPDIIDFNTGGIIEGKATIEELGARLLENVIEVASGKSVPKAVGLGQDDFIPWKRGVSL